jgi:hypothetical protein
MKDIDELNVEGVHISIEAKNGDQIVEIINHEEVPDNFLDKNDIKEISFRPNKGKILEALKKGEIVPGTRLTATSTLNISI